MLDSWSRVSIQLKFELSLYVNEGKVYRMWILKGAIGKLGGYSKIWQQYCPRDNTLKNIVILIGLGIQHI